MQFEFQIYAPDPGIAPIDTELSDWTDVKAAKSRAARLAKKHGGPVDLAHVDDRKPWGDRYITTVSAVFLSAWHEAGSPKHRCWKINFERLD